MTARILYLFGVVLVGWAVTIGLRALPFILFAGRKDSIPKGVTTFGNIISPVIIAFLIVYSYSSLAWSTPWPYFAGFLTIAVQLLMKNPLVSILAGTILYMCLLSAGCASERIVELDVRDPSIHYSDYGIVMNGTTVSAYEVVKILKDNDVPTDRVIHIRLESGTQDLSGARTLMGMLAKGGYTRPVLVSERKAESYNTGKKAESSSSKASTTQKKIRYKRAGE